MKLEQIFFVKEAVTFILRKQDILVKEVLSFIMKKQDNFLKEVVSFMKTIITIINMAITKRTRYNKLIKHVIIKNTEAGRKVQQVATTMAIEDMYLSKEFIEKLLKVSNGEMTTDDLIQELNNKYAK